MPQIHQYDQGGKALEKDQINSVFVTCNRLRLCICVCKRSSVLHNLLQTFIQTGSTNQLA